MSDIYSQKQKNAAEAEKRDTSYQRLTSINTDMNLTLHSLMPTAWALKARNDFFKNKEYNKFSAFMSQEKGGLHRYAMLEETVPKKALNKKIKSAHSAAFQNKSLSLSQKIKRRNAYKEKAATTNEMRSLVNYVDFNRDIAFNFAIQGRAMHHEMDTRWFETKQHQDAMLDLSDYYIGDLSDYTTKGERDGEVEFDIEKAKTDEKLMERVKKSGDAVYSLSSNSEWERLPAYDSLLQEINDTDLSEFEYKNNDSFLTSFASKYRKLRAFSHGTEFLNIREDLPDMSFDPVAVRAKCSVIEDILSDYENRMALLKSPYYALMAGEDFDQLSAESLKKLAENPELSKNAEGNDMQKFLSDIAERKQRSGFTQGASVRKLLDEKLHNPQTA